MKRAFCFFGLALSSAAAGAFFNDREVLGLILLGAAYANLKITQRIWP